MKTTVYTKVTTFIIFNNEWVIITGKFKNDTENKFKYAGIRREWITDNKINRELNGGQMCLGATVNDVIEKITDVETVDHIIETEGLDRFEAVMRYFSEKYSKA